MSRLSDKRSEAEGFSFATNGIVAAGYPFYALRCDVDFSQSRLLFPSLRPVLDCDPFVVALFLQAGSYSFNFASGYGEMGRTDRFRETLHKPLFLLTLSAVMQRHD